jgi:phosphocarrier protein HPr
MLNIQITLINKLGLHARAAMKLSELATRFQSTIIIRHKNHEINAKSILNVMALAASCGSELGISISGDDEERAMKQVCDLINGRFGEDE